MTEHEEATIKPLTANDPEAQSADILAGNIEQLKTLFPEAFTEGKIDFEVLRQLLGSTVEEREEKYGLNWHGKRKARQLALTPSTGTLRPCPEESVDWDTTQNLMIEGDNLEVLKLLQKSYSGKVKLIYIDPPYNTGKDFVYPDNFQDNIKNYLELTGQVEGGRKISSNTEASGRFHTDWLNMMYPRLKLARNLLREDGVIFISIDDGELSNLLKASDEIFGEENFFSEMVWKNKTGGGAKTKGWIGLHEYILCYAKNINAIADVSITYSEKTAAMYNKRDENYTIRGPYATWPLDTTSMDDRPNLRFPIIHEGKEIWPLKQWLWSQDRVISAQKNKMLEFNRQNDGSFKVRFKGYLKDEQGVMRRGKPLSIFDGPYTQEGSNDFQNLLSKSIFPFPKPVRLLSQIFSISTSDGNDSDDIILDFFAGSATTAHAVLDLNKQDNGNRKFILVQLPEPCAPESEAFKAGYKTIADIGKERLRRAASKIRDENPLFPGDLGFRVFKLDSSNINTWEPDRENLELALSNSIDHLKADRTEADILYELLFKLGLDLCVPIEKRTFAGKEVHSVGGGVLLVYLATHITRDEVEPLAQGIVAWHKELAPAGETTSVFRDSAFADDVAKTNLAAILQQHGLEIIRSL